DDRAPQRTVDGRGQLGGPRPSDISEKPLQDAEIGVTNGAQRHPFVTQSDAARQTKTRIFTDQLQVVDSDGAAVEHHSNGRAVLQRVVEQTQVHRVDSAVDEQAVGVRELTCDPQRTTRDRGGEGRQARHEQPNVRVQRHVVKPHGDFRVASRGERNSSRRCNGEARRGSIDFAAQFSATQREGACDLPNAFFTNEQIVDAELVVISRLVERGAARCGKFCDAGQWRTTEVKPGNLLHRNPTAVEVEGKRGAPSDERRRGDPSKRNGAGAFGNGSPYATKLSSVIPPKPIGRRYSPVRWNSPDNVPAIGSYS